MQRHQDLIGYRIKSYNLLRVLGQGQFSKVYEAYNDQDGSIAAIKAIPMCLFSNKTIKELTGTEIKIMTTLKDNPNIVKYIDNFKNSKTIFIVMEYCEKGTLQELIEQKKGFLEDDAKEILMQLINGFKGLHEFNIIHRDFKAANIMIKGDSYKIADLGFAKMLENKNQLSSTCLGTPLTQAPEVYRGDPYGMKADIWSLGVVFYQIIYGKYPYNGATQQMIYHQSKNLPSFSGVNISDKTRNFITRCLTFDPNARISWAQVYQHELLNDPQKLRKFGSVENSKFFSSNKLFYKKQLKAKEFIKDHIISQLQLKQGKKMQKGEIEKVGKQNQNKKNMDAAINQYKNLYMNYRNNIAFVMKYLFPNACYIKKLPITQENYLFTICKCTYQRLKQLELQTRDKVNFLGLKEYFDEFTKSAHYKQLLQIFTDDAELACLQTQEYKQSFKREEIKNSKLDEEMKSCVFEYQNLLMDGLDLIKNQFPRQKLIIMIETLQYLRKDKSKQSFQHFQKYLQTVDFKLAAKTICDRQIQQLSQLWA